MLVHRRSFSWRGSSPASLQLFDLLHVGSCDMHVFLSRSTLNSKSKAGATFCFPQKSPLLPAPLFQGENRTILPPIAARKPHVRFVVPERRQKIKAEDLSIYRNYRGLHRTFLFRIHPSYSRCPPPWGRAQSVVADSCTCAPPNNHETGPTTKDHTLWG